MEYMLEQMLKRRSVRIYTEEAIPAEILKAILQAGLTAPSGRNRKPLELILVTEREKLEKLAASRAMGSQMLAKAGAAILVVGNPENSDTWVEDCSIAMAYMHLAADAMGIGSCWIQGRMRFAADGRSTDDVVRELTGYPQPYQLEAILSLGMIDKHPETNQMVDVDECARVHKGQW